MAVRTALLTSRNINLDTDFSKYIESVTTAGIISGFDVTASSVAPGIAWVPCTRTNGETIYALVQNFNAVSISGNWHVVISIPQNIVDNGGGNEDGTGIATIEVVANLPSANYLELASISSGVVTKVAPTIKKLGELDTEIESLLTRMTNAENRIEALEEAGAIDHLEETGIVWELYTLSNVMYLQKTPTLANSTLEANVGDVAADTEIHIQAIGSGTASDQLKLKVKMSGSPTTSLKVEVRKGIQVTVTTNSQAYRYWDSSNIIATGTLAYTSFSSDWAEVTFTLDNSFWGTKGELLDVVVYQTTGSGAYVNADNYYKIACDNTQTWQAFRYIKVNGSTRTTSTNMPYLTSTWFVNEMFAKFAGSTSLVYDTYSTSWENRVYNQEWTIQNTTISYTCNCTAKYRMLANIVDTSYWGSRVIISVNGVQKLNRYDGSSDGTTILCDTGLIDCNKWDVITIQHTDERGSNWAWTRKLTFVKIYTTWVDSAVEKTLYPIEVKGLGSTVGMTSIGKKQDGTYTSEFDFDLANTAQTWGITLGNAIWYLKLKYKWIVYKVPVYW